MTKKEKILVPQCLSNLVPLKKGFTLAEVLITLAIIGVVAALTIPNLIQNYQKKVIVSQLQKTIAELNSGFRLMIANDGVDYIRQTKLYTNHGDGGPQLGARPEFAQYIKSKYDANNKIVSQQGLYQEQIEIFADQCITWNGSECAEYGKVSQGVFLRPANGLSYNVIYTAPTVLANGAFMWSGDVQTQSSDKITTTLIVDVNGAKSPNKYGYDLHKLGLKYDGHVIPMNINGDDEYDIEGGTIGAKRIKDDGWKITY